MPTRLNDSPEGVYDRQSAESGAVYLVRNFANIPIKLSRRRQVAVDLVSVKVTRSESKAYAPRLRVGISLLSFV